MAGINYGCNFTPCFFTFYEHAKKWLSTIYESFPHPPIQLQMSMKEHPPSTSIQAEQGGALHHCLYCSTLCILKRTCEYTYNSTSIKDGLPQLTETSG